MKMQADKVPSVIPAFRHPMVDAARYAQEVRTHGFAVVEGVVSDLEVERLRRALCSIKGAELVRRRGAIYGIRNLLAVSPDIQELARSKSIRSLVEPILGEACFAVRGTFFDKVPGANWNLSWHQDSVIAVRNRADVDGFESWSLKSGVLQVQPPHEILGHMIALRIHLDDCRAENGCLRVLPGSHAHGWLDDEIGKWKAQVKEVRCEVGCGGVIAMRPLVLHASSPAESPGHRRVIHLEFAARPIPGDLQWHDQVG